MFGDVARILEKLVERNGARVLGKGGGGRLEELVSQGRKLLRRRLELFLQGVGLGAQRLDAAMVRLVYGDCSCQLVPWLAK